MGRNDNRNTAMIPFLDKDVAFYEPTAGQGTALAMIQATINKQPVESLLRLFTILEKLLVDPSDWKAMDDAMVSGEADLPDYMKLLEDIFGHDWPEAVEAPEPSAKEQVDAEYQAYLEMRRKAQESAG